MRMVVFHIDTFVTFNFDPFLFSRLITDFETYVTLNFICFMFGAVQVLNVLAITLLCVRFVWFSKDSRVATCLGKGC